MLWRIDVLPATGRRDVAGEAARDALLQAGLTGIQRVESSRVYLLDLKTAASSFEETATRLLGDPVTEVCRIRPAGQAPPEPAGTRTLLVFKRPGVMDPVEASVRRAFSDCRVEVDRVRTGQRYCVWGDAGAEALQRAAARWLANEVVDEILIGERPFASLAMGRPCEFRLTRHALRSASREELAELNRHHGWALSELELRAIQKHCGDLGRDPSDVEIETIAQTWSEHCKHKTITSEIDFDGRRIPNLLKSTIMRATKELNRPWCVSVFRDNAGIVEFDERNNVCIKVETHNHPSAIEPYGGAGTGLGGVIRDVLGCGLGAKPVANTDVFCVGPPDLPESQVPKGSLHPRRVLRGVVAGVRDYGNRMGIPTVNGAVLFDERYTANPLVYCGTVGILPREASSKSVEPGDAIVVVGGRTGRDGIHGATFSSLSLGETSEMASGGAVQIGNAIVEKRVLDTMLQARDRGLYRAVTDCGAGGLSSAVGEMGEECGAEVDLDLVPLKYEGLSYMEIWISEAQERMVLAVPQEKLQELLGVFKEEDVEATVIGRFTSDGVLTLRYRGETVGSLSMDFLHHGLPRVSLTATYAPAHKPAPALPLRKEYGQDLLNLLASWNVCSKEWIIRQYDHEVQGGSVLKPLVGVKSDAPGDAAVVRPDLGSRLGLAIGCGMNPRYGDFDTHAMALSAIDEALRNVVSVGGDPERTAILDNFSWGSATDPESLGALVRACEGCADAALAFGTPFVSGKDSLNNVYDTAQGRRSIPHSLLITALARVSDVDRCVSMDLKKAGNLLYVVGVTDDELGGSEYHRLQGLEGGRVPAVDLKRAPKIHRAVASAIQAGLVRACHDASEGGLAVALAEMVIGGGLGIEMDLTRLPVTDGKVSDAVRLFSESNTRFVIEVAPEDSEKFERALQGLPVARVGTVRQDPVLQVRGVDGSWVVQRTEAELRDAWQSRMRTL